MTLFQMRSMDNRLVITIFSKFVRKRKHFLEFFSTWGLVNNTIHYGGKSENSTGNLKPDFHQGIIESQDFIF